MTFEEFFHGTLERLGALKHMVFPRKGIPSVRRRDIGLAKSVEACFIQQPDETPTAKFPDFRPLLPPTSFIYRVSFTG